MATNNKTTQEDPEVVIESAINRSEQFIEKNGKKLLIALAVIVLAVGGYFSYQHFYKAPQADKASAAMFDAQYLFERDSFALALKGNASFEGFEEIIEQYGSTPQGNIARHYAGICCLYTGQYQQAINYFTAFTAVDGASGEIITAQNFGLMGDAYVELGDMNSGVGMYEKAASQSENIDTAPTYLKKAALVNESLGNNTKALEQYKTVKSNYPSSLEARDIDKFIARVEQSL